MKWDCFIQVLTIRKSQYAALNLQTVLQDVFPFLDHARSYHPAACQDIDDAALTSLITEILKVAAGKGISSTRDLLTFLDLAMVFGLDWSGPQLQWLNNGLREPTGDAISGRLRRLRFEAIYRLEAESAAK